MDKVKKYYAYRANIAFEDITIFNYKKDDNKENRNKIFRDFFEQLKNDRLKSNYVTREYVLLYVDSKDDIVFCNLARKRNVNLNKVQDYKIIEKSEEDYPYVKVFVDLKHQKFLIECNTSVFNNYETGKKTIENIIKSNIKEKNATITLNPISKENIFKQYLESADYIYSIKFKLNTPNFLDGDTAAEDFLKDVHSITSGDSIELTIKNKSGQLNLENSGIESFINYAECGAGIWELKYKNNNEKRTTIKSGDIGEFVNIPIDDMNLKEELNLAQLRILKQAFNKVEKIEKFKERI